VSRTYCLPERSRKTTTSWGSRHQYGTDIAQAVSWAASTDQDGHRPGCRLAAYAYGVVKIQSAFARSTDKRTFHAIPLEASSSFSLALRISLLAAALLTALVWILRLLARRLIRVLAGLSGLIVLSILLTILVGIILFVIPSP